MWRYGLFSPCPLRLAERVVAFYISPNELAGTKPERTVGRRWLSWSMARYQGKFKRRYFRADVIRLPANQRRSGYQAQSWKKASRPPN
jgi:hypothetical protein